MPGPAGGDDRVDLGGAVDAQDGEVAVCAEFGGRVRVEFDFCVDFGARGEEAWGAEEGFGCRGREEGVPGGEDVVLGCTAGWRGGGDLEVCWVGLGGGRRWRGWAYGR